MDEHQLPTMNCIDYDPHPIHRSSKDNELDPQDDYKMSRCSMPSLRVHRFIALICISLLGFGAFFCYHNPHYLHEAFSKELSFKELSWIYSINIWSAVVSCFVGGFLIDHVFGTRLGTIIYLFVLLIGQLIFATGGLFNTFWLMLCGRLIFGLGKDSLAVAEKNYAVLWFKGKELNMVFGLQLLIMLFSSKLNSWVTLPIYDYVTKFYEDHRALGGVLLLAAVTCVLSLICALILGCLDNDTERTLQRKSKTSRKLARLTDIFTFKITFWMVAVIRVAYYVAVFVFIGLAPDIFRKRFQLKFHDAVIVNSMFYPISAIAAPIFGIVIDITGYNLVWVFAGILGTIVAHVLLAFSTLSCTVGLVIMGLAYPILATSLWGLVALIVPEHQLGTANGICLSLQKLGLVVVTIAAAKIVDMSGGTYDWVELFFLVWLTIALIATCLLWAYDLHTKGNLNMTPRQRADKERSIFASL